MKTLQTIGFTDWLVTIDCTWLVFGGLPIKWRPFPSMLISWEEGGGGPGKRLDFPPF